MIKKIAVVLFLLISTTLIAQNSEENNSSKNSMKKKKLSEKNLVVFVSNENLQVVGMGFGIALSGVKQGANVTVVVGANALKYLLREGKQNVYFAKQKTPRELAKNIIKEGGSIQLCSANTEEMNLDEDDFIDGVKLVISTEIFAKVFEKNSQVISF